MPRNFVLTGDVYLGSETDSRLETSLEEAKQSLSPLASGSCLVSFSSALQSINNNQPAPAENIQRQFNLNSLETGSQLQEPTVEHAACFVTLRNHLSPDSDEIQTRLPKNSSIKSLALFQVFKTPAEPTPDYSRLPSLAVQTKIALGKRLQGAREGIE